MEYNQWQLYWKRAVFAAAWLRFVPYVRFIGLNGSMATGALKKGSDIDLYIVTEKGHIFFTRILTTVLTQFLGIRRHGKKVMRRVCLNRYASKDFMEITPHDLYHAQVFHNLIPLYAQRGMYEEYLAQNQWMRKFNFKVSIHMPVYTKAPGKIMYEYILWPIAFLAEPLCSAWQKWRASTDERVSQPGSIVVLTPQELRFHLKKED